MSTLSGTTSVCRDSRTCALSPTRSRTREEKFHARSCATSSPSLLAEPPCRPQGLRASPGGELFANHPAEDWAKSSSATSMLDNPRSSHPGNGKRITRHGQHLLIRIARTRTPIFSTAKRAEFRGEADHDSSAIARKIVLILKLTVWQHLCRETGAGGPAAAAAQRYGAQAPAP